MPTPHAPMRPAGGGAHPWRSQGRPLAQNNFFGHTILPIDEFYEKNCLNKTSPKDSRITIKELLDVEKDPDGVISIVNELFGRGSKQDQQFLYRCVRTYIMLTLFIQDDMETYHKYRSTLESMEASLNVKDTNEPGHKGLNRVSFKRFKELMKKVATLTIARWILNNVYLEGVEEGSNIVRRTKFKSGVSMRKTIINNIIPKLKP